MEDQATLSSCDGGAKGGCARPQLSANMRSSSSYLRDHQQYRPPTGNSPGSLRAVLADTDGPLPALASSLPFRGIPSPDHPPRVVNSGLDHDLSHPNCAPPPDAAASSRLVATLFYRSAAPRVSNAILSPPAADDEHAQAADGTGTAKSDRAREAVPANMAPTTDLDSFPLELPTADPEPLDHLYGSYVSPLCIASFLHLMSTLPSSGSDQTEPTSAHRCLDSRQHPRVVELTFNPGPPPTYLGLADLRRHELIYRFEREWNVDVALQADVVWRRHPRLVVFDMDSTLIMQEVIDLLAATVREPSDLGARVAAITHRAMVGVLEFDAAFRERVALLRGLPASLFEDLRPALTVTNGVRPLLRALRRLGVRTAVLSGGFQPLTSWLARELCIDHAHANEVIIDPATATLTGEVSGRIVGPERKRELLIDIAHREGIPLEQVIAVGDGANDLLMLEAAGLGVAWNAKPRVQMEADVRLNGPSMLDLLYLLGFTADEVNLLAS